MTSTPQMLDSCRHRSSISFTTAARNHVEQFFEKHVCFEHSVSSSCPVITSRRKENNSMANFVLHPIDSHSQSASSCLISPHFAAGAVGVGRDAASFLATESTGAVLITRLVTRIAGHVEKVFEGRGAASLQRKKSGHIQVFFSFKMVFWGPEKTLPPLRNMGKRTLFFKSSLAVEFRSAACGQATMVIFSMETVKCSTTSPCYPHVEEH